MLKITGRGRSGVPLFLSFLTICASQSGVAQEDHEGEAARQKFVDETEGVVARNTVHHSACYPTRIVLPVVPRDDDDQEQ